jgi:hypothetical protein
VKEEVYDWLRTTKTFSEMALRSSQTAELSVLRSKDIILKSNAFIMLPI